MQYGTENDDGDCPPFFAMMAVKGIGVRVADKNSKTRKRTSVRLLRTVDTTSVLNPLLKRLALMALLSSKDVQNNASEDVKDYK
jgi:hypothetical protein